MVELKVKRDEFEEILLSGVDHSGIGVCSDFKAAVGDTIKIVEHDSEGVYTGSYFLCVIRESIPSTTDPKLTHYHIEPLEHR